MHQYQQQHPPQMNPAFQGYGPYAGPPPGKKFNPYKPKKDHSLEFIKYFMFTYNLLIFMCGCVLLAVGIWMVVDRSFMATITGEPLYAVAAYIIIAGGALVFVFSFIGCYGAITENRVMLWIFFATTAVILVVLLLAGILALAFRAEIKEAIQETMTETLTKYYGVDLFEDKNRAITYAWDRAQERLRCCGVRSEHWNVYQQSEWFRLYGPNTQKMLTSEDKKPYVPRSCCVMDRFHRYVSIDTCTKWDLGPPRQPDGAINRALYYEGCFEAGKRYLLENSDIIAGLALSFMLIQILGLICSFMLIRRLKELDG